MQRTQIISFTVANTFLEWVEFSLFLFASPVLAGLFFPNNTPSTALLLTYGLFALTYLVRPCGALLFGHLSDTLGRKPPMVLAMFGMGLATLGMSILPTYNSWGLWAPLGLLALRAIQSLALAGEFQSAAIFLMEHANAKRRAFAGSLVLASASGGMCVGGLLASNLLQQQDMSNWRLPFVITGCLSCLLALGRSRLEETPSFVNAQRSRQLLSRPWRQLRNFPLPLLRISIVASFVSIFAYMGNAYYANFLASSHALSLSAAHSYCALSELGVCLGAPFIGYTLTHPSRTQFCFRIGLVLMIVTGPYLYSSAASQQHVAIILAMLAYTLANAMLTASIPAYLFQQLPIQVRCSGVGFAWNMAAGLIGGPAPLVAATLVWQGWLLAPGFLISTFGLLTMWAIRKDHPSDSSWQVATPL